MLFIGAEHIFPALNYEKMDCGDSEDSSGRQAGLAYIAIMEHIVVKLTLDQIEQAKF